MAYLPYTTQLLGVHLLYLIQVYSSQTYLKRQPSSCLSYRKVGACVFPTVDSFIHNIKLILYNILVTRYVKHDALMSICGQECG